MESTFQGSDAPGAYTIDTAPRFVEFSQPVADRTLKRVDVPGALLITERVTEADFHAVL
jgi:hypothetical protein